MNRRGTILTAAVVLVPLLAAAWFLHGGGFAAGAPPAVSLQTNNFEQLRIAFNSATGNVRVVLLLSPT
jgi:uncharacterized membrane protein YgaE (UPF0421/DUF939 family)